MIDRSDLEPGNDLFPVIVKVYDAHISRFELFEDWTKSQIGFLYCHIFAFEYDSFF